MPMTMLRENSKKLKEESFSVCRGSKKLMMSSSMMGADLMMKKKKKTTASTIYLFNIKDSNLQFFIVYEFLKLLYFTKLNFNQS